MLRIKEIAGEWKVAELKGQKNIKGEKGIKEVMGEKGIPQTPSTPSTPINPFSSPFSLSEIEKIPFYPLNHNLPPIIQLKLKCKELNYLLNQLQKSLEEKMRKENTMTLKDKYQMQLEQKRKEQEFEDNTLKQYGIKKPD